MTDTFSHEQGAFIEPVAVAVHSTGRIGDMSGRNVVVLGAGPIGNLIAQAAKRRGAKKVLITDLGEYRLEVAADVGIDEQSRASLEKLSEAARRVFRDEGFDLAFEAAGNERSMDEAIMDHYLPGGSPLPSEYLNSSPSADRTTKPFFSSALLDPALPMPVLATISLSPKPEKPQADAQRMAFVQ